MDCFQSQSTVDICIAGLNRRAGYAIEFTPSKPDMQHDIFQVMREYDVYLIINSIEIIRFHQYDWEFLRIFQAILHLPEFYFSRNVYGLSILLFLGTQLFL